MKSIRKILEERSNYLLQLKIEKEKEVIAAPQGYLRICNTGNRTQYYHRVDPKDYNGVYIRDKDIEMAQKLAQKDYDKKVISNIEKELHTISKLLKSWPKLQVEEVYETLNKERKKLVQPIIKTEEEYVKEWENFSYVGKTIDELTPEMYTLKGERVRSKSEVIIAGVLHREGIPYRYECPIRIKGFGSFYPDFTVLNIRLRKEFYWEHLGMMDDADYVENAIQKIKLYEQNGIFAGNNLILTYETKKNPINQKYINQIIDRYLR